MRVEISIPKFNIPDTIMNTTLIQNLKQLGYEFISGELNGVQTQEVRSLYVSFVALSLNDLFDRLSGFSNLRVSFVDTADERKIKVEIRDDGFWE